MQSKSPVLLATILLGVLALGATAFLILGPKPGPGAPPPGSAAAAPVPTATPSSRWVASRDIPPRTVISSAMMRKDFSSGKLPVGALNSLDDVRGQLTREPIGAGETVLLSSFTPRLQRAVDANIPIPTGYRGVAIWVDPDQTAAGLVDAGDRIDVVATHKLAYEKAPSQYVVGAAAFTAGRTIAQNLLVLGVDKSIKAPAPTPTPVPGAAGTDPNAPPAPAAAPTPIPPPTAGGTRTRVLVAALPDIAARLVAANDQGLLHVTIRNPSDGDAALVPEAREYPSRIVTILPKTASSSGGSSGSGGSGAPDRSFNQVPQPSMPQISPVTPAAPTTMPPMTVPPGTVPSAPTGAEITVIRGTEKSLVTVPKR